MIKLDWLTDLCAQAGPRKVRSAHPRLSLTTTRGRGGKPCPLVLLSPVGRLAS